MPAGRRASCQTRSVWWITPQDWTEFFAIFCCVRFPTTLPHHDPYRWSSVLVGDRCWDSSWWWEFAEDALGCWDWREFAIGKKRRSYRAARRFRIQDIYTKELKREFARILLSKEPAIECSSGAGMTWDEKGIRRSTYLSIFFFSARSTKDTPTPNDTNAATSIALSVTNPTNHQDQKNDPKSQKRSLPSTSRKFTSRYHHHTLLLYIYCRRRRSSGIVECTSTSDKNQLLVTCTEAAEFPLVIFY